MTTGLRIPRLAGHRLDGVDVALPDDLRRPTLLLVAYHQWQQAEVDTWLGAAPELAAAGADYLEVPLLTRRWLPARRFIDGGMRAAMDAHTRAHTATVYADPRRFRRELGLQGGHIAVLLTLPDGEVTWRSAGPMDESRAAELRAALEGLGHPR